MSSKQLLQSQQIDGVTVVSFVSPGASIDESLVTDVSAEMESITESAERMVLNMENVEFFGSSFIEVMFRSWRRLQAKNGGFAVCCLHPYCREVLEITNLIDMWGGQATQAEAIEAVKAKSV